VGETRDSLMCDFGKVVTPVKATLLISRATDMHKPHQWSTIPIVSLAYDDLWPAIGYRFGTAHIPLVFVIAAQLLALIPRTYLDFQ
jgi:hypothetical protein